MDFLGGHPDKGRLMKWLARHHMSSMVDGKRVFSLGMPFGFSSDAVMSPVHRGKFDYSHPDDPIRSGLFEIMASHVGDVKA